MDQKRILSIGLVCLDTVWICKEYPVEDTDQRCLDQCKQRGGNASNSSTVLATLGVSCEFFGTIGNLSQGGSFLKEDFALYGVNTEHCVVHDDATCPESLVIINNKNGSRTILHSNKNLPEVTFVDFEEKITLNKSTYKWIHFEGRPSVGEITKMLQAIDQYNATCDGNDNIFTSVELEKEREELGVLLNKADYIFIGKEYASFCGFTSKEETVRELKKKCRNGAYVICAWGEDGAIASTLDSTVSCPISQQDNVVDTLAAGDTFIASTIAALSSGKDIKTSITFGCQVAGTKVSMHGFKGLQIFSDSL